jgi:polyhydroxybutyrate depolymerase
MIRIKKWINRSHLAVYLRVMITACLAILLQGNLYAQKTSFIYDNLKRTFKVYVPASFNKKVQPPLVIALHGRGGNGESMVIITRSGFNKLADRDGFIVVYPDGIDQSWNDGRVDQQANDRPLRENINDAGFIAALIDTLTEDYNIDLKRIYITGISNGAIMSYRLACEYPGKIAAIAPVDGNIPYLLMPGCSPSRPVSVLAINNINDPVVPFEGGDIYGHFHRVMLGKVLSVKESVGFWVRRNMCTPAPVVTMEPDRDPRDGTRVTKEQYLKGLEGTEVILYAIDGGGHTWPGGVQYLPTWLIGKTSRDIDANEVIWAFFKKHLRE